MQVTVGSYFNDESRGVQRELHVSLDSGDGERIFTADKWTAMSVNEQVQKLSAMADIHVQKYAASRGFRTEENVVADIQKIIARDLS